MDYIAVSSETLELIRIGAYLILIPMFTWLAITNWRSSRPLFLVLLLQAGIYLFLLFNLAVEDSSMRIYEGGEKIYSLLLVLLAGFLIVCGADAMRRIYNYSYRSRHKGSFVYMNNNNLVETGKYVKASALALPPAVWTLLLGLGGILAYTYFGEQYGMYVTMGITALLVIAKGFNVNTQEVIEIINSGLGKPVLSSEGPTAAAIGAPNDAAAVTPVTIQPAKDGKLRRFFLN